jgi:hypothetical protein
MQLRPVGWYCAFATRSLALLSIVGLAVAGILNTSKHSVRSSPDEEELPGQLSHRASGIPPQSGRGRFYYVSPGGSDRNLGTEEQPFASIQKAADLVQPGDTVIVDDGVYRLIGGTQRACGSNKAIVCLTRGGTPTDFVTFRARNKWGAKLDGQAGRAYSGFAFYEASNYVRIQDFEIYGMSNDGSSDGIDIFRAGKGASIIGNHIHDIGRTCTDTSNGQAGVFVQRNDVTIERNVIHDIGRFGPGEEGCHPSTPAYQNHDHAIYLSGNSNSEAERANGAVIRNNVFYNIGHGFQVHLYHGSLSNILVANNTFAFSNPFRDGQLIIYGVDLSETSIVNNIFYQPGKSALSIGKLGTMSHVVISHNLTTAGKFVDSISPSGMSIVNNVISRDPSLVDPTRGDFHLRRGSAAIDAGLVVPEVLEDLDGLLRPQGRTHAIGAYEFPKTNSKY